MRRVHAVRLLQLLLAVAIVAPTIVVGDGLRRRRADQRIADALAGAPGILRFDLQDVEIGAAADGGLAVDVRLDDVVETIVLRPYSLRSPEFRLVVRRDGADHEIEPPPPSTYRGYLRDRTDVPVAAFVRDGVMRATVLDGDTLWSIQPVADLLPDVRDGRHVAYRSRDTAPWSMGCGTTEAFRPPGAAAPAPPVDPLSPVPAICPAPVEIAFDSDFEMFDKLGSAGAVIDDIESIMNAVELIYVYQLEMPYFITFVRVLEDEASDPYSSTTDGGTLLAEFRDEWNSDPFLSGVPRDVAHLFTGRDELDGGTGDPIIGVAYLGVICNAPAQSYGISKYLDVNDPISPATLSVRTQLTAHELGHNWNAEHCDDPASPCGLDMEIPDVDCGIMCSTAGIPLGGEQCPGDPLIFGDCATTAINAHRAANAGCLDYPLDYDEDVLYLTQYQLLADDAELNDRFGTATAVSVSPKYGPIAVVGAPLADPPDPDDPSDPEGLDAAGAVYVYRFDPELDDWIQRAVLTADDGFDGDTFGASVDVDGDRIVVGTPGDDEIFLGSGAVYVFEFDGTMQGEDELWEQTAKLKADAKQGTARLGLSVSIDGDLVAAGAPGSSSGGLAEGHVHLFELQSSQSIVVWEEIARLSLDGGAEAASQFGLSVSISTNPFTGDPVIVAGAPQENQILFGDEDDPCVAGDGGGTEPELYIDAGAAYIFEIPGDCCEANGTPRCIDAECTDTVCAIVPECCCIEWDETCATQAQANCSNLCFNPPPPPDIEEWLPVARLGAPSPASFDRFGTSVHVNGDQVAVGATDDGSSIFEGVNAGSVHLYRYDPLAEFGQRRWSPVQVITAPDVALPGRFGSSISIAGDRMVVGASTHPTFGPFAGAAFAYGRLSGQWFFAGTLLQFDGDSGDGYGISVDITGSTAIVGALLDEDEPPADLDTGVAYVFTINDPDCDGDGILDACGLAAGTTPDCNENGVPDTCDIEDGTSEDVNGPGGMPDGVPDECQVDCNMNGTDDGQDIADGTSLDCNLNEIPDECDVDLDDPDGNGVSSADCNFNAVPDECDIGSGASADCNFNSIPDECDIASGLAADCNANGVPDSCDVIFGAPDCNGNGIPDSCELASGAAADCNFNGVPDTCDIDAGLATDCDGNQVPDNCQIAVNPTLDCDFDGVLNACEIAAGTSFDCNFNGFPDACDLVFGNSDDCNGNAVPDSCDIASGLDVDCDVNGVPDGCQLPEQDCNFNGVVDFCDIADGTSLDDDGNFYPDECLPDVDCNGNFIEDVLDIELGISVDCDGTGIPDECEFLPDGTGDCNDNGVYDGCEIADGDALDIDLNNVPDECQPDCNFNSIPDGAEIAFGLEEDCNLNGSPDSCDVAFGLSIDLNGNGIPDECEGDCNFNSIPDEQEIQFGLAQDCNENGIPDECDIAEDVRSDINRNGVPDVCEASSCEDSDVNGDGAVTIDDLVDLVLDWGPCPAPCPSDIDGNGVVDIEDLLSVFVNLVGVCDLTPVDPCPEDLNNDDTVDVDDVVTLIIMFGPCDDCAADLNNDGVVDVDDLVSVILAYGPCPEPAPPCPADANGDGIVGIDDLVAVVLDFGTDGSANGGDVNEDGVVDVDDIVEVVVNFGPCPGALPFCLPDVSGDGVADLDDLIDIAMSIGPCGSSCPADLTQDGVVTIEDLIEAVDGDDEGGCGP